MTEGITEKLTKYLRRLYKYYQFEHYFYVTKDGKKISAISWDKNEAFEHFKNPTLADMYIVRDKLIEKNSSDDDFPTLFNFLTNIPNPKNWYIQLFEPKFIEKNRVRRELRESLDEYDDVA